MICKKGKVILGILWNVAVGVLLKGDDATGESSSEMPRDDIFPQIHCGCTVEIFSLPNKVRYLDADLVTSELNGLQAQVVQAVLDHKYDGDILDLQKQYGTHGKNMWIVKFRRDDAPVWMQQEFEIDEKAGGHFFVPSDNMKVISRDSVFVSYKFIIHKIVGVVVSAHDFEILSVKVDTGSEVCSELSFTSAKNKTLRDRPALVVDASSRELEEKEIELVMSQASCNRSDAIDALESHGNDVVEAIIFCETKSQADNASESGTDSSCPPVKGFKKETNSEYLRKMGLDNLSDTFSNFTANTARQMKAMVWKNDQDNTRAGIIGLYQVINVLGEGQFGSVLEVCLVNDPEGRHYAVKQVKNMSKLAYAAAQKEAAIIQKLAHQHVIKYVDTFLDQGIFHMVMELVTEGDLAELITSQKQKKQSWSKIFLLYGLVQISSALMYLHGSYVIHRDLKPANILIAKKVKVSSDELVVILKITDFGLARVLEGTVSLASTRCGTRLYMSPEAHDGVHSYDTDVWSMGVIFFEMCMLKKPFKNVSSILEGEVPMIDTSSALNNEDWTDLKDLCNDMLNKDHINRVRSKQVHRMAVELGSAAQK